jgi:16S rRNA (guanine527-N7)-methyltransferase
MPGGGLIMIQHKYLLLLEEMLTDLGLEGSKLQKTQLLHYVDLLLEGLAKQRLTGENTAEALIGKQLYDSLYLLKFIKFRTGSKILDLGSGGGLPGIPLKILVDDSLFYLMDANKRKIIYLDATTVALGLNNLFTLEGRAEKWGQSAEYRESFDYIVIKAVSEMAVLAELGLPLLRLGGQLLLYKGPRGEEEANTAVNAIAKCGGKLENVWDYCLPSGESRSLYQLLKIAPTPPQYPRADGKPAHKPL